MSDDGDRGGTWLNTAITARLLAERNHGVVFAASVRPGDLPDSVDFLPIPEGTGRSPCCVEQESAETLFRLTQPDVVLFGDRELGSHLAAKELASRLRLPHAVVCNFVDEEQAVRLAPHWAAIRASFLVAGAVVTVSDANLSALRRLYALPEHVGRTIWNGRPASFFSAPQPGRREHLRRAAGLGNDTFVCLSTARYEARKGHRVLLRALHLLAARPVPRQILAICTGADPLGLRALLQEEANALNLGSTVRLLGPTHRVVDLLDMADVFVLPSSAEGMPLAITEAMARRLPVIATAVGGVPEQLGPSANLLPDPSKDGEACAHALADALARLAADPVAARGTVDQLYQRARTRFHEDAMGDAYDALIGALHGTSLHSPVPMVPPPPAGRLPIGRRLDLSVPEDAAVVLGTGWGHCEPWGVWSVGGRAELILRIPETMPPVLHLALTLVTFMAGTAPYRCTLIGGGDALWRGDLPPDGRRQVLSLRLPPRPPGGTLRLNLIIEGTRTPREEGIGPDGRHLGVGLCSLLVTPPSGLPLEALPPDVTFPGLLDMPRRGWLTLIDAVGFEQAANPINRALTVAAAALDDSDPMHLAGRFGTDALALLSQAAAPAADDLVSQPLTCLMIGLHRRRPDLQAAFNLDDPQGRLDFLAWFVLQGLDEAGLHHLFGPAERHWLISLPPAPRAAEHPALPGLAVLLLRHRPDLRAAFDPAKTEGRVALAEWLHARLTVEHPGAARVITPRP